MAKKSQNKVWGFSVNSILVRHMHGADAEKGKVAYVRLRTGAKATSRLADTGTEVHLDVVPFSPRAAKNEPRLKVSQAARIRDAVGETVLKLEKLDVGIAEYDFDLKGEQLEAALIGLELALYRYKRTFKGELGPMRFRLKVRGKPLAPTKVEEAVAPAIAMNLARHLVNVPPNLLNPVTYAEAVLDLAKEIANVKVDVWDEKRLEREGMGLHLAVGSGSNRPPRLVHLSYRPRAAKKAPVALVGKGITFDSGGLDIKPASGMRLMKKDMGGSAAVLGTVFGAALTGLKTPIEAYMALAENSLDGESFRPSDVLTSRSGKTVEIHNTDAEGRLVLADALDVAVTEKEKPRFVVDVATLTGAIKVALGADLAGLFANDTRLSNALNESGRAAGDLNWPMPLVQKYRSGLNSGFADMVNYTDGFGGAITAALFLESFVRDVPWAHLDIYGWKDSAEGAWAESGGSGQAVSALLTWLGALK